MFIKPDVFIATCDLILGSRLTEKERLIEAVLFLIIGFISFCGNRFKEGLLLAKISCDYLTLSIVGADFSFIKGLTICLRFIEVGVLCICTGLRSKYSIKNGGQCFESLIDLLTGFGEEKLSFIL